MDRDRYRDMNMDMNEDMDWLLCFMRYLCEKVDLRLVLGLFNI